MRAESYSTPGSFWLLTVAFADETRKIAATSDAESGPELHIPAASALRAIIRKVAAARCQFLRSPFDED